MSIKHASDLTSRLGATAGVVLVATFVVALAFSSPRF
jgi:hypothetical protein